MKRICGLVILALSVVSGISAMEVLTVSDVVEACKAGRHGRYTPIELQAVARTLNKDDVLAKVAEIERQGTEASFDDIDEALALLWILYRGRELKQDQFMLTQSKLHKIRREKEALIKAAAGLTVKELERQLEEQKRAQEQLAQYTGLKDKIIATWRESKSPKKMMITDVVRKELSGPKGIESYKLVVFFSWLEPDTFKRAQALIDNPEVATITQIDDLLALLAALSDTANSQSLNANYLFSQLDTIRKAKKEQEKAPMYAAQEQERQRKAEEDRLARERHLDQLQADLIQAYRAGKTESFRSRMTIEDRTGLFQRVQEKMALIETGPEVAIEGLDELLELVSALEKPGVDIGRQGNYMRMHLRLRKIKAERLGQ